MKQLSVLDAAFLYLESPEMPMHVGALHLLELPDGYEGDYAQAVRDHFAARLHLAPVLARRVFWVPFDLTPPVWKEGVAVDLDWHVKSVKLPKPGNLAQLEKFVGETHAKLMDRSRPMWEFYVITGLSKAFGKNVVGLYSKLHHAAIDGKAGVALANLILDISAVPREVPAASARKKSRQNLRIGMAELIGGALSHQLDQAGKLLKTLPVAVTTLSKMVGASAAEALAAKRKGDPESAGNWQFGPRTHFNKSVSATRSFAIATVSLPELKALGKAVGATINDLVMLLVSGGLRRYLKKYGPLPRKSLTAAVPVSLRAEGDTSSNTQATMTVLTLATHLNDPMKRLAAIKQATVAMKDSMGKVKDWMPTDLPALGLPWLMQAAAKLYGKAKVADRMPPIANLVISNVPGPQVQLYLAGARMLAYHPVSIVVHGVGLNVTVQSYNGALDFGCIACGEAMPDIHEFAQAIEAEFEELLTLAGQAHDAKPQGHVAKKSLKKPSKNSARP
jgi:diacylglycerol O-acyltransferase / wax synthase